MILSDRRYTYLPICLVIGFAAVHITTAEGTLRQLHVLFRHGDRTPDNNGYEMYPNDPYLNYDFSPMGLGQLTNKGKMREYAIGEMLRKFYGDYLGDVFTPESVFAVSSDYDRTKMSLQLVLAALYPPAPIQKWNNNLNWQPIPAQYYPRMVDDVFTSDDCASFKYEYERNIASPEGQRKLAPYRDFMRNLSVLTGKEISTPLDLYYLYHTFAAEDSMDLKLPDWAYEIFPYGELFNATVLAYDFANYNRKLSRIYIGKFLTMATDAMLSAVQGNSTDLKKIYLYSGHESNIAALQFALNVYEPHVPEYSSSMILELHEKKGQYFVKIQYYLGIPPIVKELAMPGCDVLCPLDEFLKSIDDLIPADFYCDKTSTSDFPDYRFPDDLQRLAFNLIRTAKEAHHL